MGIVFASFGMRISSRDAGLTFGEARQAIIDEMEAHPGWHCVRGHRLWHVGSTELALSPGPKLTYGDLLILLSGIMLFFRHLEFAEADMYFGRIRVGGGEFVLLGSAT